ncbi:uncharacterized protein [Chironomus tepperi]|uniref:uncharacterized protein n=1 Tax=Chironomus tepperi TaxID=113505 RepID=UPI00391F534B
MGLWIFLALFGVLIYLINQHFFSYWSKRGVPTNDPTFILGDLKDLILGGKSVGELFASIYHKSKNNRILGMYFSYRPALLVNDPVLIQEIMIKNFTSFHDRNTSVDEKTDPLTGNLFILCGQRWRDLRVKLSPTFTSGKLKGMYPTIRDCAQVLQDYIEKEVKNGSDVFDIRDLLARFTTNVISSVAFGIDNDSINDRENIFRKMGIKIFDRDFKQALLGFISLFVPKLLPALNIKFKRVPQDIEDFFMTVVQQTIDHRAANKDLERKDFMQLLIQLKDQGFPIMDSTYYFPLMSKENIWNILVTWVLKADKENSSDNVSEDKIRDIKKLTFNEVAAQSFLFFIAGFETSSSTSNFCLFELSKHPDIQRKVQEEIDRVIGDSKEITYDMLGEMKFLECCIDEALRKYPIVSNLVRECSKDHTFSGTKWTVEKGTTVFIPVLGMHRDPEIYDDPMEFRPSRFLDSANGNGKSNGIFYLPFGDGPRNCIGARMGKLQTKLGLAMILSKFSFELVDKKFMREELEFDKKSVILAPKENIMLKAIPRNRSNKMEFWILAALIFGVVYLLNQYFFSYWSKRGIPYKEPKFIVGEIGSIALATKPFGFIFKDFYEKFKKEKILGIYFSYRPALVVNDPVIIQEVMIKSFNSFHDRNLPVDEETNPLAAHLFTLCGQKWRDLRVKLSPTFTSGKLKGMYPTIRDCAQVLQDYIGKEIKNGNDVFDIRDLLARFTTNVISSVAFGIENDCINDRENIFRKIGIKVFTPSLKRSIMRSFTFFVPNIFGFLREKLNIKIKITPEEIESFFMSVVQQTIEHREKNKDYERKDFMQLLIQLKNQGFLSSDKDDDDNNVDNDISANKKLDTKKLTFNEVVAQAFLFFIAGFETSSSTSNFCLLELCKNPKIQKKVQEEIDQVMKEANSKEITYDMLGKMKYLECCIDEALRIYPIVPVMFRECTKDHTFSGTNWTVEKGTQIFMPILAIQRDPDVYDNPMQFIPERFMDSPTGNGKSDGLFYMPFGDGPRNCIGARMGKLQTKLGLAMILSKYSFELTDKSLMDKEIEFETRSLIMVPKENIMLKVRAREDL